MQLSHIPLRATIGAFILNSGLVKRDLEGQAAQGLHGFAASAFPPVKKIGPQRFARILSSGEIALGAALLIPVIPGAVVGAGLVGFASSLLWLYWKTPGMHAPGNPRPTEQGTPLAKDVWMLGAGLTLVAGDLLDRCRR